MKQKKLFRSKEFELTENSLRVKTSKPFDHIEIEYNLEKITAKFFKEKHPNVVFSLVALGMLLGVIVTVCSHFFDEKGSAWYDILFYFVLFLISLFFSWLNYESNYNMVLQDGTTIAFYIDLPTDSEFSNFLCLTNKKQKDYLLKTYAKSDGYLTNEQISNNLNWLWDRNIIDAYELSDLRLKLLPLPKTNLSVGFTLKSKNN
ncbi:MAG TPA: hypothetical protein VK668_06490 [Mucilaginibacter sp.]|nr:hypothetical protein [Mucilaginibacter sp.]